MSFRVHFRKCFLSIDKLRLRNGFVSRVAGGVVWANAAERGRAAWGRGVKTCLPHSVPAAGGLCLVCYVRRTGGGRISCCRAGARESICVPATVRVTVQAVWRLVARNRRVFPGDRVRHALAARRLRRYTHAATGRWPFAVASRPAARPAGSGIHGISAPDRRSRRTRPQDSRLWRLNAPFR